MFRHQGYLLASAQQRLILAGSAQSGGAALLAAVTRSAELDRLLAGDEPSAMVVNSRGDDVLDRSLAAIGGKGLFLKELELAMLRGEEPPQEYFDTADDDEDSEDAWEMTGR